MKSKQEKSLPFKKKKPMKKMDVVLYALLFVFLWAAYNQYVVFRRGVAIHAILKLIVACTTG